MDSMSEIFIIDDLLKDPEEYERVYNEIEGVLEEAFDDEKVRRKEVKFKFYVDDKKTHKLTRPRFLTNLIMFIPLALGGYEDDFKLDERLILDFDNLNNSQMEHFMNEYIIPYYMYKVDPVELNEYFAIWRGRLKFSKKFTSLIGHNYSLKDEFDKFLRDKEYREVLTSKFDENLQPKEISEDLAAKTDILVNSLKNDPLHPFQAILKCGEGLKIGQLQESHVGVGNKPDIYGNIIPMPLNANYLYHGINSVSGYVVDTNSGRKAAIMNDEFIGKGGYLSRMMQLNSQDTWLDPDPESDCNTHRDNLPRVVIKNEGYLKRLRGRYYYKEDGDKLKCIDDKDKSLIGKTIRLRSPVTCNGETICQKCFGKLAYFNKDYHIGIVAASAIARPIFQNVMSAKHLLQANSVELIFNEEFNKFFEFSGNMIYLKPEWENMDESVLSTMKLRIYKEDVHDENGDEDELEGEDIDDEYSAGVNDHYVKYVNQFTVKDMKTKAKYKIKEVKDWNLYMTPSLIHLMKAVNKKKGKKSEFADKAYWEMSFEDLDLENVGSDYGDELIDSRFPLFYVEVANIELTKPLHKLKGMLDVKKEIKTITSIDVALERAFDLIVEAGIHSQFYAFEVVYRTLIRDKEERYSRPNFSKPNPEYELITIRHSLRNNPSPIVTLSFEDLKRRIVSPGLYMRTEAGLLDKFFQIIPDID